MAMVPGPETEHHHHHHSGHRWLDMVLAVSAVVISMISLFLALQHGRVMEKMVEASTWPYVVVEFSTSNPDGSPHVSLTISNKGVGPARIDTLEVFYKDVAQADPGSLLKAIVKPANPNRHLPVLQSDVLENVLPAKEEVRLMDVNDVASYSPAEYELLSDAMSKLQFRVCFCSVFDECSVLDTRKEPPRPARVTACPAVERLFQH